MSIRSCRFALTSLILAVTTAAPAKPAVEPKTAAAVQAADDAWGAAEANGDAAFVDGLLLPGYVSVGPTGKVTTKAAIVAGARKRGRSAAFAAEVAAWKAEHPSRAEVSLFGDTAVLTWVLTKPDLREPISSSDVFVYRQGRWLAVYSQHTSVS
ncbi:Nuclear transport factor 2 family protein [Sphingomonas antarctica]|uniref:nuclear transport factor 2 family protein n=1 Tax=Sphingomonas antarctica TaxID=2040274 RepID=UPI0039EBB06C